MTFASVGGLHTIDEFRAALSRRSISIPVDSELLVGHASPLGQSIQSSRFKIANRFAVQPMEGWDGTLDGRPSPLTIRRWEHFGRSGAGLIWGGEAVAVRHDGRANPNQLLMAEHTRSNLAQLRETLIRAAAPGVVVGLQLTHSGRFSRPNSTRPEPRILYRHPIMD